MSSRGCGSRKQGGLYFEIATSEHGRPIEDFLLDPVMKWEGEPSLRAPMLIESPETKDQNGNPVKHIIMMVGKEFYPTIPDFIEEGRILGISKRIPRNFPFEQLTPGLSRIILMHHRAIPKFGYLVDISCPRLRNDVHECVYRLWELSALHPSSDKHSVEIAGSIATVTLPCGDSYRVNMPLEPRLEAYSDDYHMGLFISLPLGNLAFINKNANEAPKDIVERAEKSGWSLMVKKE
ncbi:hypothetical protein [Sulfuricurvum sp.]|uniref:hypothetical protein n=1 Tax=Sulfuricurvum sp. TaxID=2025608 RepID=UPI003569EB60